MLPRPPADRTNNSTPGVTTLRGRPATRQQTILDGSRIRQQSEQTLLGRLQVARAKPIRYM